ncbi:platelet binding protein GspB-like [Dermacentor albipictus]|uniref:platelet binding protein GspB-like n=1 Tax=Dermacentor albipictus TaxID=60249 RepID=UPI0038FD186D
MKKTTSKPKQKGQNQRQPQPQPNPKPQQQQQPAAAAAATTPAAPAALAQNESSDSASTSTSSSWSITLNECGTGTADTTSTSNSTAAFETGGRKAARSKRRPGDTPYPRRGKRSSSTDTEVAAAPKSRGNKCWLYSVVAIVLIIATASAINASLRAVYVETDEPLEHVLPKQATTARPPHCGCANGSATNAANPGAAPRRRRRRLTTSERRRRTSTELPDGGAAGGNASAVERPHGEDAVPDDGAARKVKRKATRSLVAHKIRPARRKHGAGAVAPTASRTPPKNRTGTRAAPLGVPTRAKRGRPNRATEARPTPKHAAGTSEETSKATPRRSETVAYAEPGVEVAADWEQERKLVDGYGERDQPPSAAAERGAVEESGEVGASNAAAQDAAA